MKLRILAALVGLAACSSSTGPRIESLGVDSFDRAQLGPDWITGSGSAAGIVGGQNFGALALGPVSVDWAGTFATDQFSEIVIASGKDPNMLVQAHVRRQVSSGARYGFHYNPEKAPAVWEIKYDGVPTAQVRILNSVTGSAPVSGDVIRIEARGRAISGFVNGQLILSTTDNAPEAILTTGGTGITARLKVGTSTTYPTPIVASWRGGSL